MWPQIDLHSKCFEKESVKVVLVKKKLADLRENTCVRASYFIKLQSEVCNSFKNDTPAHIICCEFSEIFKDMYVEGHLQKADSMCFTSLICLQLIWSQLSLRTSKCVKVYFYVFWELSIFLHCWRRGVFQNCLMTSKQGNLQYRT